MINPTFINDKHMRPTFLMFPAFRRLDHLFPTQPFTFIFCTAAGKSFRHLSQADLFIFKLILSFISTPFKDQDCFNSVLLLMTHSLLAAWENVWRWTRKDLIASWACDSRVRWQIQREVCPGCFPVSQLAKAIITPPPKKVCSGLIRAGNVG